MHFSLQNLSILTPPHKIVMVDPLDANNSKVNSKAPDTSGALMVEMWNLHCLADLDIILWSDPLENFCFIPF